MDPSMLTSLGLTGSQAKAYLVLVQLGSMKPTEMATKIKESRTNIYKILDRLTDLGLTVKDESGKTIRYRAENPVVLETLARQHRDKVLEQEKKIKMAMPNLLNFFYTYSEQPGVRFFQGKENIKGIFEDILRTHQTVYLIRSPADVSFYDKPFFDKFKKQRAKLGIKTLGLTPDHPNANRNPEIDAAELFTRTWLPAGYYSGSAEWYVYGNKMAIVSYGEEAIGMIIESPIIAESFKQIFGLLQAAYSVKT